MKKYRVGYTCGVFDLFHVGHLNLLERCKSMCDYLIVGVCDDKYVTEIKKKTPVYNDKLLALEKFKFDVLFSGDDWKGSERYKKTEEQFKALGATIEYLPYTNGISTTQIKEELSKQ